METSLHRQLKAFYAGSDAHTEVRLGRFRIDAIAAGELIEIQHGSLASIRDKIRTLTLEHRVRVVKPIVVRKCLVRRRHRRSTEVTRRLSPKRGTLLDLFHDLVYFCRVFPHPNLVLEVPLVSIEEWRVPGHGRRRWRRRSDHQVEDQKLLRIAAVHQLCTAADLADLLPANLPQPFDTQVLANTLRIDRWFATRIAYTLRETGGIEPAGKAGRSRLYRLSPSQQRVAAANAQQGQHREPTSITSWLGSWPPADHD